MNCSDIYIYLHRYVDNSLDEKSLHELKIHVASCEVCRKKYDKFTRFFELLKSMPYSIEPHSDLIELLSKELLKKSLSQVDKEHRTKIIQDFRKKREQSRQEKFLNETRGLTKKSQMSRSLKSSHPHLSTGKIISAIIAGILIFSALAYFVYQYSQNNSPWTIESINGAFELNGTKHTDAFWYEGDRLVCSDSSLLQVIVPGEGRFQLAGKSSVLLVRAQKKNNQIFLEYGSLIADNKLGNLGLTIKFGNNELRGNFASYKFSLSKGKGELSVLTGAVDINGQITVDNNYFVKFYNYSSGTPLRTDAEKPFKNFVEQFDTGHLDSQTISGIIKSARPEDSISLLSILERSPLKYRGELFQTVANFFPPPTDVTYDGIIHLNKKMLSRWKYEIEKSIELQ
ncbi:anti-sigma factor family protein [Melioribacter sp. OK-6-Me]|uniref:anti-sigma factor family protein n=1 Tax=unclassified Melioribacter TaxID=2627329 RepID=UPI003ED8F253